MTSRELVVPKILATGSASIATATTTAFDFGTPDDVKVAIGTNYALSDRLAFVITASTAGTTDSSDFIVLDAPDSSGSIGSTAAAVTTTLPAGAAGNQYVVIGVQLQPSRPWLRLQVHRAAGTTDTLVCRALLVAMPHSM